MSNYKHLIISIIILISLIISHRLSAQEHMHEEFPVGEDTPIGEVNFEANCSAEVQDDVNRALGMLHHMMYETSRSYFEAISETDPNCAMAYWGVATTLFQPLWGTRPSEEDIQQGWQTINKAIDVAESEREKLLIQSTAGFFREPETADFQTRIRRWTEGMEDVYESYPDDLDIAAFYALTRLTIAQFAENSSPLLDEAETILREVYEQEPTHPGAIHYTIHATDIDGRAENALDIVEAYGEIAPDVPHALHMPTHIYVRLGDWPNVIDWNLRSAEAALNHPVNGAESHHYLHAMDYLAYAYLQQGKDDMAEKVFKEVLNKEKHQASFVSAFHLSGIPARLAVEQRDWERATELEPRTPAYLPWDASPWPEGMTWYAKGLGAVHTGDLHSAKKSEQKLRELRDRASESGSDNMANYIEIERRVLEGWIAHEEGDADRAVELMKSAADLEETVEKHPVTPGALQPPYEALGDLLLELDRPTEALNAYEASDDIWPGRMNTLLGAAVSARVIGEHQKARSHIAKLLQSSRIQEISSNTEFIGEVDR
ncbi:MAG: hypothetical protein U5K72_02990 [Balneolaceae bacterium]|nr:hypothetical protein [Balneolaceae bacterium]